MKRLMTVLTVLMSGFCVAGTTQQAVLNLIEDKTVEVAEGDVLDVAVLGGAGHVLTKKGAGTLLIRSCVNPTATVDLKEGRFEMAKPDTGTLFSDAFFHVDVSAPRATEDEEIVNGTNFVKVLRDMRGDGYPTAIARTPAPFISPVYTQNGLPLLDFGTLYYKNNADEVPEGYGAVMDWSERGEICEYFLIAGDSDEVPGLRSRLSVGATGPQYIGDGSYYDLMRGRFYQMASDVDGETLPLYNNNFASVVGWYSPSVVDGVVYQEQTKVPLTLGMHLINTRIKDGSVARVNNFGSERNIAKGGFRLGEMIAFSRTCNEYERMAILSHLQKKWFGRTDDFAKLLVSEGTSYDLDDTGSDPEILLPNHERQGRVDLSADLTIDIPAGKVLEVAVLAGVGHTLTKTGEGALVVYSCINPTAVVDVKAGRFEMKKPNGKHLTSDAFFHVDAGAACNAADGSLVGGTNFIRVLRDVRAGASVSATTKDESKMPFISPDHVQNGLPLLDFGSFYYNNGTFHDGYGAVMDWSATLNLHHCFIVAGDTEEVPGLGLGSNDTGPQYIGSSLDYPLMRGRYGQIGTEEETLPVFRDFSPCLGWNSPCRVDGVDYPATKKAPLTKGMHLIDVKLTQGTAMGDRVNNFGSDRNLTKGGFRLGEAIVFGRDLDDFEREAIQAHLTAKWFGRMDVLARIRVAAGASYDLGDSGVNPDIETPTSYTKVSDGAVEGDSYETRIGAGVTTLDIRAGRVTVSPLLTKESWLHVDASAAATLSISNVGDKATVTEWRDVSGNGRFCSSLEAIYAQDLDDGRIRKLWPVPDMRRPYVRENYLNGLPVIDCRRIVSESMSKSEGTPKEGGGAFKWSESCLTIREALMVVMDTEDVKGYTASQSGSTPFLGAAGGDGFAREYVRNKWGAQEGAAAPIAYDHPADLWQDSDAWVDGIAVSSVKNDPYPDGFHVLDIRTTKDRCARAFAADSNVATGGQRLGEVLVFTNVLADAARAGLTAALRWKWFADTSLVSTRQLVDITVGEGAELELPEALDISGTLVLAGVLKAPIVKPARLDLTSGTGSLVGTLDLTTPGEILISTPTAAQLEAGAWRVLPCTGVSAIAKGWTVTCAGAPELKLAVRADGLYVKVVTGLAIIVR